MSGYPLAHRRAVQHLWYGEEFSGAGGSLCCWRVIKGIAAADGPLCEIETLALQGRMVATLASPQVIDELLAWECDDTLEDLVEQACTCDGPWIVYNGLYVALADGELSMEEYEAIATAARLLGVDTSVVNALHQLVVEELAVRSRRIRTLQSTTVEPWVLPRLAAL